MALAPAGSVAWTDMPAALTEFGLGFIRNRQAADLTGCREARVSANTGSTAGSANAEIRVQYSIDGGAGWNYLDGVDGPKVGIAVANAPRVGLWVPLAAAAKADVLLRVVGINGDGVVDPTLNLIALEVR